MGACAGSYGQGCRCTTCRAENAAGARRKRQARMAVRILVDGRLTAPLPPERHGRPGTYSYHGCRCVPCTRANTGAVEEWHKYRRRVMAGRKTAQKGAA